MLQREVELDCDVDVVGRGWELARLPPLGDISSSASDVDDDCGLEQGGLGSAKLP